MAGWLWLAGWLAGCVGGWVAGTKRRAGAVPGVGQVILDGLPEIWNLKLAIPSAREARRQN